MLADSLGFGFWVALVGLTIGLLFFFHGFRILRKYHLLADTPRSPIGSLHMGLVQVHGKARGDRVVKSPITQTACLFYRVDVRKFPSPSILAGGTASDFGGDQFYLEDKTGKVLIDARGAELDLPPTAERGCGGGEKDSFGASLGGGGGDPFLVTDGHMTNYALTTYAVEVFANQPYRVDSIGRFLYGPPPDEWPGNWAEESSFRLKEYCIRPDRWYDLTGTCIEDPRPPDLKHRNMIVKGEHESIFLISDKSESRLEHSLKWKAVEWILGGAAAALGCALVLLWHLRAF